MMGECNCACMPVQNSFGRNGLLISAFPGFLFSCFLLLWFHYKCFPWYTPFLAYLFIWVIFLCCDYSVVFVCFPFRFSSVFWPCFFCSQMFVFLWFICLWDLCFFFKLMLLCFLDLGVQMQMPNEIISVYTASVPVILFIAIHYWKN